MISRSDGAVSIYAHYTDLSIKMLDLRINNFATIDSFYEKLEVIIFRTSYLKPLPPLPTSLKYLIFDTMYIDKLPVLPNTLKVLHLHCYYNDYFPELPDNLVELNLGYSNTNIQNIPKSLTKIVAYRRIFSNEMINDFMMQSQRKITYVNSTNIICALLSNYKLRTISIATGSKYVDNKLKNYANKNRHNICIKISELIDFIQDKN